VLIISPTSRAPTPPPTHAPRPQLNPLLNTYFIQFDNWFPLFGTISIAIFGLYLLLAVAKGNAKFGTRFFLIKVHPMEPGKTLMNSFMFNVALVLLCTLVRCLRRQRRRRRIAGVGQSDPSACVRDDTGA
jgi:hypothetical protein